MLWQYNPYAMILIGGAVPLMVFACLAWRKRSNPTIRLFLLICLVAAGSIGAYVLQLFAAELSLILFWLKVGYVFRLALPGMWLLFVLVYAGHRHWLTPGRIAPLFLIPALHILLAETNEWHGLNWRSVGVQTVHSRVFFDGAYGAGFWLGTAYNYLVLLVAAIILIRSINRATGAYRRQSIFLLVVGIFAPWLASVLTVTGLNPLPQINLVPFSIVLTYLPVGWVLFRYQIFNLVPSAQELALARIQEGIIIVDDQNLVVSVNDAARGYIHIESGTVIGTPIAELAGELAALVARCPDSQPLDEVVEIMIQGEARHFEAHVSPLMDKQERHQGHVIILHDITEQKRSDDALRQSEARYRDLFENSPVALWVEDFSEVKRYIDELARQGVTDLRAFLDENPEQIDKCVSLIKVIDVNKSGVRLHKAKSKDDLIHNLPRVIRDDTRRSFKEELIVIFEGKTEFEIESINYTMAGVPQKVNVRWSIAPDSQDDLSRIIVCITDITERKAMEDQLRKLSQAVEQSPSVVLITDTTGAIEYVNPKFTEVTGYTLEEVMGRNPRILKSGEKSREEYRELWDTIIAGREWRGEFHNRRKNGELYWEFASISGIKNQQGQITHYLAVKEDITARKETEEMVRQYAAELEQRNRELDAFGHTVAHDLKAPLGLVIGYVNLLMEDDSEVLTPTAMKYLTNIKDSSFKMNEMINNLLLFASLRDVDAILVEVRVESVIQSAINRFRNEIEAKQVCIEVAPNLPSALGQPLWIEEIFANLIGNAIKYSGVNNQQPNIAISGSLEGGFVRYEVKDNGVGITPEDQQALFEMFARFHRDQASGTGLGLSIVLRIVTKLNGQVGVESVPGEGSTFWFKLPAAPMR